MKAVLWTETNVKPVTPEVKPIQPDNNNDDNKKVDNIVSIIIKVLKN